MNPHQPGAKLDDGKVRLDLVFNGFANALNEVAKVATFGAEKYTEDGWVTVPDGIKRYTAAMHRHLNAEARGWVDDPETDLSHAAHAAWNALARLDLMLRKPDVAAIEDAAFIESFNNAAVKVKDYSRSVRALILADGEIYIHAPERDCGEPDVAAQEWGVGIATAVAEQQDQFTAEVRVQLDELEASVDQVTAIPQILRKPVNPTHRLADGERIHQGNVSVSNDPTPCQYELNLT